MMESNPTPNISANAMKGLAGLAGFVVAIVIYMSFSAPPGGCQASSPSIAANILAGFPSWWLWILIGAGGIGLLALSKIGRQALLKVLWIATGVLLLYIGVSVGDFINRPQCGTIGGAAVGSLRTFNTSEVLGNAMVAGIGNLYYPGERHWNDNVERLYTQLATDAISQVLKEFWPDIKRKYFTRKSGSLDPAGSRH